MPSLKYNPQEIEKKWQEKWARDGLYKVKETSDRPKFYALTMLPYTSGDLHIGHWYAMVPSDIYARFKRMQGYNVLHPMGFDAFGLPAENAAIKHGIHPYKWTMNNIENMRRQLKSIGAIYDWDREIISCLPEYYKWTQWFFLKMYKAGLAYRAKAPVNWCPKCQTVLANEQVVGEGICERCSSPVVKKNLEQWFFKITKYADELLDFSNIDWPERIKTMQSNWIGKSEGAEISFALDHKGTPQKEITVFTTRPDTIFGVTFFLLAPEHPMVSQLTTPDHKMEVEQYIAWCQRQTEYERTALGREKTGVFLGSYVTNRLNNEKIPIYITDYVLMSYGTGAVMGVPAHDERDLDFASKFNLPVTPVIVSPETPEKEAEIPYTSPGIMINSGDFTGLSSKQGYEAICSLLERKGWGRKTTSYRIRDWLISRQRYWGAPIPMVYCDKCGIVPVSEKELPVLLPQDAQFKPTGESPLKYCQSFVNTTCPKCGRPARRETDTMDTFMCSNWYYLRYTSPDSNNAPFDPEKIHFWMPVDLYTGGAEHAVMHLLYARFFTKAIRDIGLINFGEPFAKLFNQGTVIYRGSKMSKSKGNVIAPDKYVTTLGADAVRGYIIFIGPWELGGEWSDSGIVGISRWLNRIWSLITETAYVSKDIQSEAERQLQYVTHKTIKKVTEDLGKFRFNTMLASLMEFTNYLAKVKQESEVGNSLWTEAITYLLLLLAPTAPHIAEELWEKTGHPYSIHNQHWPEFNAELTREETFTMVIQVNGKLRDRVSVPANISETEAKKVALTRDKIKNYTSGKTIAKVIYVTKRLVSIVAQ
ncbi:MAG: leucine--tRNA ligase [Dehalococcoidia bacterium]|nr:leucine--tRNA ligase [Dehalococcoidia bacterium]